MENSMTHTCPVCKGNRNQVITLPYKTFRHLDFAEFKLASGNIVCECSDCGAVFRSFIPSEQGVSNDIEDITDLYKSEYYSRHKEEHMLRETEGGAMLSVSEVQANIIYRSLPNQSSIHGVLDIGCFDGKLLLSLKKRLNAKRFLGFDVDERVGFPYDSGIEFTKKPIDEISGTFDLILMSHSIMYIPDLEDLFNTISRLLSREGMLFIQVPDLSLKPCAAMLGDQHHYFSQSSISSMLSHFDFECSFYTHTPFPNDILLFSKLKDAQKESPRKNLKNETTLLNNTTGYLDSMAENIKQISNESKKLAILGTTIDASFAYHLIPDYVLFFVDENPKKVGTTFLGKAVRHPESLSEDDIVIIPMGKMGETIRERFSKKYSGTFVST